MFYFDLNTEIIISSPMRFDLAYVWDGLTKWVFRCEMSHVLQNFPIKLFLDAFIYSSLGLYY